MPDRAILTSLDLCEAVYTFAQTGHVLMPDGFSAPTAIRLPKTGRPWLLRDDPLDIIGMLTSGPSGQQCAVFRGTQWVRSLRFGMEWELDGMCFPKLPLRDDNHSRVHRGFCEIAKCISVQVPSGVTQFTGHSLGGAIATVLWGMRGGVWNLTTFGCPRVGDSTFARYPWRGTVRRVVNRPDIVPRLPLPPEFEHLPECDEISGPGGIFRRKTAHSLESYRTGLEREAWTE